MAPQIDWKNLGFAYMDTGSYVSVAYRDGQWGRVEVCSSPYLQLHVASTCLHYGQACFEGLKVFSRKDGTMAAFRPEENARRMIESADRLVMKAPPVELFMEAVSAAVKNNRDYVPPYGTGASLYVRPLLIGTSPRVGVRPSEEYLFIVLVMPVGPYYKDGFFPVNALVQQDYDRAAPRGVGHVKAAGNYAVAMYADLEAKKKGYPISLYPDAATQTYVDEFGTSNFFGITPDQCYVTPDSQSILPSITNQSLIAVAGDFGLGVERRQVLLDRLDQFAEVGACGTAAVITPIYSITWRDRVFTFGSKDTAGETLTRLYREIQGIQYGEIEDRYGWMVPVGEE
jgi:branched-chain amino acid aminotransferase